MKRFLKGLAAASAVALIAAMSASTAGAVYERQASAASGSDVYLVTLDGAPAAAYTGGVRGYAATKPAAGTKFNSRAAAVQRYVGYLRSQHADVLSSVGASALYDYAYSLNGFAAALTPGQVARLQRTAGVVSIQRDSLSQVQTDNTPTFLGLNASGGIWEQLGGQAGAGEDVIIGVVDTGIWPEHPSFSPAGYGPAPAGWNGTCQAGQFWPKNTCNNKLIGARYFEKGMGHFGGQLLGDYQSARDHDGHGSHTASTAGGNAGVPAKIYGRDYGTVSGMAPRARIAAYKACWPGGCANSDTTAAIDAAVADGVDVINYSIGDNDPDFLDSDDLAFLFARQAGVFVAASAGNSGPGASTTDHGGPWMTTVAASTQNRSFVGSVTLGNTDSYQGVTLTPGIASTPIVDGEDSGVAGADAPEGCLPDGEGQGLDPAKVTGKIVVCQGSFSRAARGLAVKNAGGVGMVLYTASENDSLMSDTHHIPTVHVRNSIGLAIKDYIAAAGSAATASMSGGAKQFGGGNTMAAFSSRGPLLPSDRSTGDLLKPDVTAPGVQVLAANSPTPSVGLPGQLFQAIGGTSMSSPHIAGIGALLRDRHPDWTPDMMQSAIITSARQNVFKEDGVTPADPFDFGGGHVVPNGAADPGLVYPQSFDDYRAFLRSQGLCKVCFAPDGATPAPVVAPTNLNVPSVTIRALAGVLTVTRTVKNVGAAGTYDASVAAPAGVDVVVSPSSLTLAAGQTASYTVSFTATSAADFGEYAFGSLTWSDGSHSVRSPLVVRPVKLAAPSAFTATTASGSSDIPVTLGYDGPFSAAVEGLLPATTDTRTIADDPDNAFDTDNPEDEENVQVHSFSVPAGTSLARFQLFDEFTDGEDDIDIYLYKVGAGGALELVGQSESGTSSERVDVDHPAAGDYKLFVNGWQTDGRSAVYTLFSWLVPSTAAGNMTATPSTSTATVGGSATVTAAWSGLTSGTKYLGRIRYEDGSGEIGATVVSITP